MIVANSGFPSGDNALYKLSRPSPVSRAISVIPTARAISAHSCCHECRVAVLKGSLQVCGVARPERILEDTGRQHTNKGPHLRRPLGLSGHVHIRDLDIAGLNEVSGSIPSL